MNVDTLKEKLADIDADTLRNFIFDLYRLNYIRAKRADTSLAWINSIFLVMNLLVLLRVFFTLCKKGLAIILWSLSTLAKSQHFHPRLRTVNMDDLCSQTARS